MKGLPEATHVENAVKNPGETPKTNKDRIQQNLL